MHIVPYSHELHHHIIELWLHMHGLPLTLANNLPYTGFCAEHEGTPIAAAFLRCAEGGVGLFNGIISNPEASARKRHEALDNLVLEINNAAKDLGINTIIAFTTDASTLERAQRHGFKKSEHSMLTKEL